MASWLSSQTDGLANTQHNILTFIFFHVGQKYSRLTKRSDILILEQLYRRLWGVRQSPVAPEVLALDGIVGFLGDLAGASSMERWQVPSHRLHHAIFGCGHVCNPVLHKNNNNFSFHVQQAHRKSSILERVWGHGGLIGRASASSSNGFYDQRLSGAQEKFVGVFSSQNVVLTCCRYAPLPCVHARIRTYAR